MAITQEPRPLSNFEQLTDNRSRYDIAAEAQAAHRRMHGISGEGITPTEPITEAAADYYPVYYYHEPNYQTEWAASDPDNRVLTRALQALDLTRAVNIAGFTRPPTVVGNEPKNVGPSRFGLGQEAMGVKCLVDDPHELRWLLAIDVLFNDDKYIGAKNTVDEATLRSLGATAQKSGRVVLDKYAGPDLWIG